MSDNETAVLEDVEAFRARAAEWLAANFSRLEPGQRFNTEDDDTIPHQRELMRKLFDAGLVGITWPKEYGGQGLTVEHLRAFTEASQGYELPLAFHLPTMTILAPTILDYGTEEQKQRHLPAILRGEELWVQFLSEPSGGSDLAAVLTRATKDGDLFILSGAKIWSSAAYRSDYALCVCRTDWDQPKHAGISVLIVKIHQPGITVEQIRQVNGTREFCQEFFDDVPIPVDHLVGAENDGWTVASRLLQHEKLAVGGGHPMGMVLGGFGAAGSSSEDRLVSLARRVGRAEDPLVRQYVGAGIAQMLTQQAAIDRVSKAIASGAMPTPAAAILKLLGATGGIERSELAARIAGSALVADAEIDTGVEFLSRQGGGLAGGSNEIQRNIISERVLGLPREPAADRGVPFREVARGSKR